MKLRHFLLAAAAASLLFAAPIVSLLGSDAQAGDQPETIVVPSHCVVEPAAGPAAEPAVDVSGAYICIDKFWDDWSDDQQSVRPVPTYSVSCTEAPVGEVLADQEPTIFVGIESLVEAHVFSFGSSCTITEFAFPNNGWIEDPTVVSFTFKPLCDFGEQMVPAVAGPNGPAIPCVRTQFVSFTNTKFAATKTADVVTTRDWKWALTKTANPTSVALTVGQSKVVDYTITPTRVATETSALSGTVQVSGIPNGLQSLITVKDPGVLPCLPVPLAAISKSDALSLGCDFKYPVLTSGVNTATVTYANPKNGDSETLKPFAKYLVPGTVVEKNASAELSDVYDGGAAQVYPSTGVTNYAKTYTCSLGTVDDNDQALIPGETETDVNVARLNLSVVKLTDAAEAELAVPDLTASATVKATCAGLPETTTTTTTTAATTTTTTPTTTTSTPPLTLASIAPPIVPPALAPASTTQPPTTTGAPASTSTTTVATSPTIPATALAAAVPTIAAQVLGEQITNTPAFTGTGTTRLVGFGVFALLLGLAFTTAASFRRRSED